MKSLILISCIVSLSVNAADLITKSGKEYKDFEITDVTDKSVKIAHEGGAAVVDIADLPDEVKASIESKAKAYKPPEKRAKLPPAKATVYNDPIPAPVQPVAKAAGETKQDPPAAAVSPKVAKLQAKIKERETEIADLKKELKPIVAEIFQKGSFKSTVNENKVAELKDKKTEIEAKIKGLEYFNEQDADAIESINTVKTQETRRANRTGNRI